LRKILQDNADLIFSGKLATDFSPHFPDESKKCLMSLAQPLKRRPRHRPYGTNLSAACGGVDFRKWMEILH